MENLEIEDGEEEEYETCDTCGCRNESVSWEIDPYAEEMTGAENWEWFCSDCYTNAVQDI